MGLVILRLGIAAMSNLMVGVAWCVAASRDEGRVTTDDDIARGASERRSTRRTAFFLCAVFGEPLKSKLIWVS